MAVDPRPAPEGWQQSGATAFGLRFDRLGLFGGAAVVLLQQPIQDLHPRRRAHRPALHPPTGVEAVIERDVGPASGRQLRVIEFDVDSTYRVITGSSVIWGSLMRL